MKKELFTLLILFGYLNMAYVQGNLCTIFERDKWFVAKKEIQNGLLFKQHTTIYPYLQHRLMKSLIQETQDYDMSLSKCNYEYIYYVEDSVKNIINSATKNRNWFKYFNTYPGHFYSMYGSDFYLTIDPLLSFSTGIDLTNKSKFLNNSRGLRLRVGIDNKVFLFSDILETQAVPLEYISEYANTYKAYPGAGFVKSYSSSVFNVDSGYDFLLAEGGIIFRATKNIDIVFAHSRSFIGQGIRSLLLSDGGAPQIFLKLNSQFGRFNYQNIFSELSSENRFINDVDKLLSKKYLAAHYLSLNIGKNWNFGLFESVVFNRKKGFELQYLNPIILYRAIEQAVGSPDNVLIGFQSHLNVFRRFSLYGQFILDEFVLNRVIKNNTGWWANKYGFQLGLKYPNLFSIKNLNAHAEWNILRPYTYSYSDSISNYSHYNQALAHPLGSNFKEFIGRINYSIGSKAFVQLQIMSYKKGLDTAATNFGGNILKSNTTRGMDYNNSILQGLKNEVNQLVFQISYELFARTWIDLNVGYRHLKNPTLRKNSQWIEFGLRMNLDRRNYEF